MWQYELHPPHLINFATLPCESQNTENVILQWDITKESCTRCIVASSIWTRVIMCLIFTYLGCYTAKHVWNKDSWHRRPAKTLDANLFWFWLERHQSWRVHLRSCVHAGGGHFERIIVPEYSLHLCESKTTQNVLWPHASVCLSAIACVSVCLSAAVRPHYCTDPDITWGVVEAAP